MHASIPVSVLPFLKTLPLCAPILLLRKEPPSPSLRCFCLSPKLKWMGSLLFASGLSQKVWLCQDRNIKMEADLGKQLHCQEFQPPTCKIPSQPKPWIPTIITIIAFVTLLPLLLLLLLFLLTTRSLHCRTPPQASLFPLCFPEGTPARYGLDFGV